MSQQLQTAHPTFINLPQPPSQPDTPSEIPGTPTSTTTSLSALSTTAIKDGHRGALHHRGHQHSPSTTSLEAERADRISRLTGLSSLSTLRGPPPSQHNAGSPHSNPTLSGVPANPPPAAATLTPAFFDAAGQPVAATKVSTVGSASATESVGGRTTSITEVGGDSTTLGEDRDEDMLTEMDSASASGYIDADADVDADAMDEDLDNLTSQSIGDRMSDDGSASLVGFGEGAGSTLSGPIYHRRPLPSLGSTTGSATGGGAGGVWGLPERASSGLSEGATGAGPSPHHQHHGRTRIPERETGNGTETPVSQSAVRERREARMVDGVALDGVAAADNNDDVFVDTTTRGPVPVPTNTRERDRQQRHSHRQQPPPSSPDEASERVSREKQDDGESRAGARSPKGKGKGRPAGEVPF